MKERSGIQSDVKQWAGGRVGPRIFKNESVDMLKFISEGNNNNKINGIYIAPFQQIAQSALRYKIIELT